jgi:hypothetical protein
MRQTQLIAGALAFGAASLLAGRAQAADCTTLGLTSPYYVVGSTAIGPVVEAIAAYLAVQPQNAITVVYGGTGSCVGVQDIINTSTTPSAAALATPSGKTGYFIYYDSTGKPQTCDLAASDNVLLSVALSDVFAQSCPLTPALTQPLSALNITERLGPVQAMTFVVPQASSDYSISAEAAYLTFGFGGHNSSIVTPWPDVMSMFQRGPSSGTQAMLAKAIGVPSGSWYGVTPSGTAGMISAISTANTALNGNAIGILGTADVDPLRQTATPANPAPRYLAYQHYHQNCGYLPDSTPTVYDKRNVRDGHYAVWGPLHVFTLPHTDPNIDTIVNDLTGFAQLGATDVIAQQAKAGLVPQCAMRVQRSTEMGDLTPLSQTAPCSCYFEHVTLGLTAMDTTCGKCTKTADCAEGYSCQTYGPQGYCEPP